MTWLVRTAPHWRIRYACGHTKAECACRPGRTEGSAKRETSVDERCPRCRS